MSASKFCNLCGVSLDLHTGPDTCDTAARKADLLERVFGDLR